MNSSYYLGTVLTTNKGSKEGIRCWLQKAASRFVPSRKYGDQTISLDILNSDYLITVLTRFIGLRNMELID